MMNVFKMYQRCYRKFLGPSAISIKGPPPTIYLFVILTAFSVAEETLTTVNRVWCDYYLCTPYRYSTECMPLLWALNNVEPHCSSLDSLRINGTTQLVAPVEENMQFEFFSKFSISTSPRIDVLMQISGNKKDEWTEKYK